VWYPNARMSRVSLFCLTLLASTVVSFSSANAVQFSGVVAFGDSLSDLGNTYNTLGSDGSYELAGYNSAYYDVGRWSNGPVWVEHLNNSLGLSPLQLNDGTSLFGTDFAYGGSTSGTGYEYEFLTNLQTQVSNYRSLLTAPVTGMPDVSTTLFTVWSGGNDIIYLVSDGTTITPTQVANNISSAITSLYDAGGRHFLVPNIPPLGDKPSYVNNPSERAQANEFVNAYNPILEQTLASLRGSLSDITIISFDVYSLFTDVLANPGDYGFTNVSDSAYVGDTNAPNDGYVVPNPDQYLFWDGTHPTRVGHQLIGDHAFAAVATLAIPEPTTWALLGAGLVAVIFLRRRRFGA